MTNTNVKLNQEIKHGWNDNTKKKGCLLFSWIKIKINFIKLKILNIKLMAYEDSHLTKENGAKHKMLVSEKTNIWMKCGVTKVIFSYNNKISNILKISSYTDVLNMYRPCPGFKLLKKKKEWFPELSWSLISQNYSPSQLSFRSYQKPIMYS